MDALYAPPVGEVVRLRRAPVPASAPPPELAGHLDDLSGDLGWRPPEAGSHLALEMNVGLPAGAGLADPGHDLDDYLFPVVQRLGPVRFDAVFGAKRHAAASTVRVAHAAPAAMSAKPPRIRTRISAPATDIEWKRHLHDACRDVTAHPAPPGPVSLVLRFTLSRRRNWTALWKPAVQSLGPVLGVDDPEAPYRARAARVTSLALHRRFDDLLGHRVLVEVWWRSPAGHG